VLTLYSATLQKSFISSNLIEFNIHYGIFIYGFYDIEIVSFYSEFDERFFLSWKSVE
jgi:hypothetical protein